jgi:hypothetical protein
VFKVTVLGLFMGFQVCGRHWMIVLCRLQAVSWACESSRSG